MQPELRFVDSPKNLPRPPKSGRVVTLDLAFAAKERFETGTRPFIEALGPRLAKWIDHHPHPAWEAYRDDPRFLLVDKSEAPACPQLVTPERVREIGPVDHILAHADFDGLISAVKFLLGGRSPYPEADEDGRAIDAPGQGYVCSPRGQRLAEAIERSRDSRPREHGNFLREIARALVEDHEAPALTQRIESLREELAERQLELAPLLEGAVRDHPEVLVLRLDRMTSPADKKYLLRALEEQARVGVIEEPQALTVATFDPTLRLNEIPALHGTESFAWGRARYADIRRDLLALLEWS